MALDRAHRSESNRDRVGPAARHGRANPAAESRGPGDELAACRISSFKQILKQRLTMGVRRQSPALIWITALFEIHGRARSRSAVVLEHIHEQGAAAEQGHVYENGDAGEHGRAGRTERAGELIR